MSAARLPTGDQLQQAAVVAVAHLKGQLAGLVPGASAPAATQAQRLVASCTAALHQVTGKGEVHQHRCALTAGAALWEAAAKAVGSVGQTHTRMWVGWFLAGARVMVKQLGA